MKRFVLLLSPYPALREVQSKILREAGFVVASAADESEADQLIRAAKFHALVLGCGVTGAAASKVIPAFREANQEGVVFVVGRHSSVAPFGDVTTDVGNVEELVSTLIERTAEAAD